MRRKTVGVPVALIPALVAALTVVLIAALAAPTRAAEVDPKGPKGVALAFAQALAAGNTADMRQHSIGSDQDRQAMDTLARMVGSFAELSSAAVARFGEEGKDLAQPGQADKMFKAIRDGAEQIDRDRATIVLESGEPIQLKKVDGAWKIDLAQIPKREEIYKLVPIYSTMAEVAQQTAMEVKGGRYKSVEEARKALGSRMLSALAGTNAPATAPATGPSTRP
jgi:hypothetical protein